uniref:Nitroreductase domain-containing protein n=1 Tax=Plectus sambesii TaxID=2011161 RepID=A0A914XBS9_9BILA
MGVFVELIASLGAIELSILTAIIVIVFFAVTQPWRSGGASERSAVEKLIRPPEDLEVDDISKSADNDHDEESVARIPYHHDKLSDSDMLARSQRFYEQMNARRSVRVFSKQTVSIDIIKNIVRTAGTSPSGAHLQPWTFAIVSNAEVKSAIRKVVEEEEEINYAKRMGEKWVKDVTRFSPQDSINWIKPYLEEAPYLIVVLKHAYQIKPNGERQETYYNEISTSIAVGLLLAAIQMAGLVTVTTTPLNAGLAIRQILDRPANEKVSLLLPVGHPASDATIPDLKRKPLEEIMQLF